MQIAAGVVVTLTASAVTSSSVYAQPPQAAESQLKEFHGVEYFWQQLEVAKRLVAAGDRSVIELLEPLLEHEDRHLRGNAAFVLAGLGDSRGLDTIAAMLSDRAERPVGQGIPSGRLTSARQIESDRYYAVHLLGELRNGRAVDVLLPLLGDPQVNYKVSWALGKIGDPRAIPPLIAALGDADALVRVTAIEALAELRAAEALPKLHGLLNDHAVPRAGARVPVSHTAQAAIATLQGLR